MTCQCGCGQPTPIATQTSRRDGLVRGQPRRFIHGHNARLRRVKQRKRPTPRVIVNADYETADLADGEAIAKWLADTGLWAEGQRTPVDRQLRRWRKGGKPSFYTVDDVLCRLGRHPWELPDDVWLAKRRVSETVR